MTWADYIRQKLALRDHSDSTDLHARAGIRVGLRADRKSYEMSGTWRADSYLEGGFYLPPDPANPKVAGVEPFGGGFFISIGTENDDGWRPLQDADTEQDERYGPLDTSADGLFPLCDPRVVSASPTKATPMVDPAAGPFMLQPAGRKMPHDHPVLVMAGTEEKSQHLLGVGAWAGLLVCDQRGDEAPSLSTAFTDVDGKKVAKDRMAPIAASFRTVHSLENECQGALELGQPFGGRGWGFGAMCGLGPGNSRSIGLAGSGAGGLLHVGTITDKHRHHFNKDGEAVTCVELNLFAPWHFSDEFCAAPQFGGEWIKANSIGVWTETELRHDSNRTHTLQRWDSASKSMASQVYQGQMRWETRLPLSTDGPDDPDGPEGDGSISGEGDPNIGAGDASVPPSEFISGYSVNSWLPFGLSELLGVPFSPRDGSLGAGSPTQEEAAAATSGRPSVFAGGFIGAWDQGGWGFTAQPGETRRKGGTATGLFYVHPPELTLGHFFRGGAAAASASEFEDVAPSLSYTGIGFMPDYAGVWFGMPILDGDGAGRTNGFKIFQSGTSLSFAALDAAGAVSSTAMSINSSGRVTVDSGVISSLSSEFGDSSTDVTLSSNTTLTEDLVCKVLDLAGYTLNTAGYRIFCDEIEDSSNSGSIVCTGSDAVTVTGGAGAPGGSGTTLGGGSDGGDALSPGDDLADARCSSSTTAGVGGTGGAATEGTYAGDAGGAVDAASVPFYPRTPALFLLLSGIGTGRWGGGSGGGSGGYDLTNNPGAGGGGGGVISIFARIWSLAAGTTIDASGGDGADSSGGNSGGGGGGGGGRVITYSATPAGSRGGTFVVSGGSGGGGTGTGAGGSDGADGEVIHL